MLRESLHSISIKKCTKCYPLRTSENFIEKDHNKNNGKSKQMHWTSFFTLEDSIIFSTQNVFYNASGSARYTLI